MQRAIGFEDEHDQFRASIRAFFEKEALPYLDDWERAGAVDRRLFEQAGPTASSGWTRRTTEIMKQIIGRSLGV